MNIDTLAAKIGDYQDVYFSYKGLRCGVESTLDNGISTFTMWYGEKWINFSNINDLINDKFFDGKSLKDICTGLDIVYC